MDKKIDKYQFSLSALLGQGSYAKVYKGFNVWTKEAIAVKVVDKALIN